MSTTSSGRVKVWLLSTHPFGHLAERNTKEGKSVFALGFDGLFSSGLAGGFGSRFGGGLVGRFVLFHGSVLEGFLLNGRNLPPGPKLSTATYIDFALLGRTPLCSSRS